jgi:hypothetical protein
MQPGSHTPENFSLPLFAIDAGAHRAKPRHIAPASASGARRAPADKYPICNRLRVK